MAHVAHVVACVCDVSVFGSEKECVPDGEASL